MALCASAGTGELTFYSKGRPRFVSPFVFPPHPFTSRPPLPPPLFISPSHYTSFGRRPLTTGYFNWIFAQPFFARSSSRVRASRAPPFHSIPVRSYSSSTDTERPFLRPFSMTKQKKNSI